jgi:hypothetical protein
VLELFEYVGGMKESFCGNTPSQKAGAAQVLVFFYDRGLEAQLA